MRKKLWESFIKVKRGVAKTLGKVYQKPLRRFTSQTRMPTGIRKPLRKVYQKGLKPLAKSRGMQSIPQHRIKRGIAL